jgi:hypothetical protein
MKNLVKISFVLLFAIFIFHGNSYSQKEFKEMIVPILDSISSPYKPVGENKYLVTYCGNEVDCVPVFIAFGCLYETSTSCYIQCYTFLFSDKENPTPSKSMIQKVSDLNSSYNYGKFGILIEKESYAIFYQNEMWFDNLNVQSLSKNIQMNFLTAIEYKKEFNVFKE